MAQTVNYSNPNDTTVRVFDQFYQYDTLVPSDEYDIIFSYFDSMFTSSLAASNFTTTLFRIAQNLGAPVMDLFMQVKGKSVPELTVTIAYYLNAMNSSCTMLGVTQPAIPNWYISRNVAP